MKKPALITPLVLLCLMACGGPPPPATPEAEPPAVEPETVEPETVEPEATEPEAEEGEATQPEAEAALPPLEPTRPPCHTLDKSLCSVTQGCAWYEKGGKGECKDE